MDIKIFSRKCKDTLANCSFTNLDGNIATEIKKEILKKAAIYKKEIDDKSPDKDYVYPTID